MLLRGLSRRQLLASDAVLAVLAAAVGWYAAIEVPVAAPGGWHEPGWVSVVVGLVLGVPVAVRRIRPELAAWTALTVLVVTLVSGLIPDYAGLAPEIALGLVLYTAGAEISRRSSVRIVIVSAVLVAAAFGWASRDAFGAGLMAWVAGACWALGRALRERRAHAVRSAAQVTALAVGRERLRIARELHDLVGHKMSLIAVRATVADHIGDDRPQEMREALRVIATTSRESLAELRQALAALRTEAVTTPAPNLADLGTLAAAARSAGLTVDLGVRGNDKVPDSLGLAVFRLVQESVTNVLKHARATSCRIDVDVGPEEVRVEVADDGSGFGPDGRTASRVAEDASGAAEGQGLIGMRERAAMFGGELVAGPRPEGGWLVTTTLRYGS